MICQGLSDAGAVLYIGKAGTINQDGSRKNQGIRTRLTKKQGGKQRRVFFQETIDRLGIDGLSIRWFVTYEDSWREPPALVEAELLSAYLGQYGQLPSLNRSLCVAEE